MRITPIALTSRPSTSAVTPQVRIAPAAMSRMLTPIPMAPFSPLPRGSRSLFVPRGPYASCFSAARTTKPGIRASRAGHSSSPRSASPDSTTAVTSEPSPVVAK